MSVFLISQIFTPFFLAKVGSKSCFFWEKCAFLRQNEFLGVKKVLLAPPSGVLFGTFEAPCTEPISETYPLLDKLMG